jgi:large subunit ribosomal protein L9
VQVVLREDVEKLGLRGEIVNVARGYARNFLLPRRLAEVATPAVQKEAARRDALRARHEAKTLDEARGVADRIDATVLRFDVVAGPTGTLFGSVTATDVADRLWDEQKIRIDRRKLQMETIKRIGRYAIPIEVFTDVTAELRLEVASEGQALPSDEELAAAEAAEVEAAASAEADAAAAQAEAAAAVEEAAAAADSEPDSPVASEPPAETEPPAEA